MHNTSYVVYTHVLTTFMYRKFCAFRPGSFGGIPMSIRFARWLVLLLSFAVLALSAHAQVQLPYVPSFQLGIGYQYQTHSAFGRSFHNNGANETFAVHIADPLTSADWLISGALEATLAAGFGGQTTGLPRLNAKSVFAGAGPHLAFENRSRLVPWVHLLVGVEHFRFTQFSPTLGSNSCFGFMVGGGTDFKVTPHIAWRLQADYLATTFQSSLQSNYSVGSGFILDF
jgi:hypothetical protein